MPVFMLRPAALLMPQLVHDYVRISSLSLIPCAEWGAGHTHASVTPNRNLTTVPSHLLHHTSPIGPTFHLMKLLHAMAPRSLANTWLWVTNWYPDWCPRTWNQGLKPAVPWWFDFDPYPHGQILAKIQPVMQPATASNFCLSSGASPPR